MSKRQQDRPGRSDRRRGFFEDGKHQPQNVVCSDTEHKMVPSITEKRLQIFRKKLHVAFHEARQEMISVEKFAAQVNQDSAHPFSAVEIEAAFIQMTDANQVFVADGLVFRI